MFDVFDPRDGTPLATVRWAWQARLITFLTPGLDWFEAGEGWL